MSKELDHHEPRTIDKRKRHGRGFTEGSDESRAARVSFKLYLRELEEALLDYDDDEDDDADSAS